MPTVFSAPQLLYICMVELATQKVWFFPQTTSSLSFEALKGVGRGAAEQGPNLFSL